MVLAYHPKSDNCFLFVCLVVISIALYYRVSQKKCLIVIVIVNLRATRPHFLELIFQLTLVKYEFGTPEKYSEDLEKFCVQADLVVNLGADKVTKEMRKVD